MSSNDMKNNLHVHGEPKPRRTNDSPIARLRIERGLTQAQLADMVDVPQSAISRWENGARTPGTASLLKLSAALNCSIEELIK